MKLHIFKGYYTVWRLDYNLKTWTEWLNSRLEFIFAKGFVKLSAKEYGKEKDQDNFKAQKNIKYFHN